MLNNFIDAVDVQFWDHFEELLSDVALSNRVLLFNFTISFKNLVINVEKLKNLWSLNGYF